MAKYDYLMLKPESQKNFQRYMIKYKEINQKA